MSEEGKIAVEILRPSRVADPLAALGLCVKAIACTHDKLFNQPTTWSIHKHTLGTAGLYPGFGCLMCEAYVAATMALAWK